MIHDTTNDMVQCNEQDKLNKEQFPLNKRRLIYIVSGFTGRNNDHVIGTCTEYTSG